MTKRILFILFIMVGCDPGKGSDPSGYLNEYEQKGLMMEMVHYAAKLPPGATHQTKFKSDFDEYYSSVAIDYKWLALEPKDDGYYFLVSRPARSITPMFEGIGGYFKVENNSLVEYNEIFRTWKMPQEVFTPKGEMLFKRMIEGKDLSIYYSKFQGDKYIEFPDGRFVFDKDKRVWKDLTAMEVSD